MVLATHWSWNLVFVCFLYGFGYPLVLKSWFSCLFCGFLYCCWLPIVPFCSTCACWKCCFAITKQRINLKTCIWPRRNSCFQKWCPPTIKQHNFWNVASRLGETHLFNITYAKMGSPQRPFSHISLYIYIYCIVIFILEVAVVVVVLLLLLLLVQHMYIYIYIHIHMYHRCLHPLARLPAEAAPPGKTCVCYVCIYREIDIDVYIYIYICVCVSQREAASADDTILC